MPVTITVPEHPTNNDIHEILTEVAKGLGKLAGAILSAGQVSLNTDWLAGMLQAAAMLEQASKAQDAAGRAGSQIAQPQMMMPPRRGMN